MGRDKEGREAWKGGRWLTRNQRLGFYKEQCHVYTIDEVAMPGCPASSNIPATDLWFSTGREGS